MYIKKQQVPWGRGGIFTKAMEKFFKIRFSTFKLKGAAVSAKGNKTFCTKVNTEEKVAFSELGKRRCSHKIISGVSKESLNFFKV